MSNPFTVYCEALDIRLTVEAFKNSDKNEIIIRGNIKNSSHKGMYFAMSMPIEDLHGQS